MSEDMVGKPPHYAGKGGPVECIEAVRSMLTAEEFRGFCKGTAAAYLWRCGHKGDAAEDAAKAARYGPPGCSTLWRRAMADRRKVVFVSGPISKGDLAENVKRAHEAGLALLKAGLAVIVPHGSCFWGNKTYGPPGGVSFMPEALPGGTTHADWYGMDLELVRRSDALVRLPGESVGADLEAQCAWANGIPVFDTVEACVAHFAKGDR